MKVYIQEQFRVPDSPIIDNGEQISQNNLTQREIQIMLLLWQGLTQNEIASRLNLSRNTVRNHVQNSCAKIGVSSTIGVLQWYIDSILLAEYGKKFADMVIIDGGYNV